jgi:hypothetical protein
MAVESGEQRDPSTVRSGQTGRQSESGQADRASNRRRILITSLLAPPAVMTLRAHPARAKHGDPSANCAASLAHNPASSAHCAGLDERRP